MLFSILRSRTFSPYFSLHKLHFDHRQFDWKQKSIQVLNPLSHTLLLIHPQNLNTLLETSNVSIIQFNEQQLIQEAIRLQVAPIHKIPFVFDVYDTECFVLTDQEHYHHLLQLQSLQKQDNLKGNTVVSSTSKHSFDLPTGC